MSYIDGFVAAVPAANKEIFRKLAEDAAPVFKGFGASRLVENWGDDVPDGKVTDFRRAVKAEPNEVVIFSWVTYPSREARNEANRKMMADPQMQNMDDMPFDGMRMIYGGFDPMVETGQAGKFGYVDGSLIPVPTASKDAYKDYAASRAAVFHEYGATRMVDAWGDDVPDGKVTDYRGAVKAEADEAVVFSWIEWPSKAVRDEAWPKIFSDPRMHEGEPPFDLGRMVIGGFAPIVDR